MYPGGKAISSVYRDELSQSGRRTVIAAQPDGATEHTLDLLCNPSLHHTVRVETAEDRNVEAVDVHSDENTENCPESEVEGLESSSSESEAAPVRDQGDDPGPSSRCSESPTAGFVETPRSVSLFSVRVGSLGPQRTHGCSARVILNVEDCDELC